MFQVLGLYVITAIIFLGLDFMGIKFLIRPLFDRHVPQLPATQLRRIDPRPLAAQWAGKRGLASLLVASSRWRARELRLQGASERALGE